MGTFAKHVHLIIVSIERNSVPVPVQSMRLFPAKICTQLTTWKTITDGDIEVGF